MELFGLSNDVYEVVLQQERHGDDLARFCKKVESEHLMEQCGS